jgi:hypothetical protein
MKIVCSGCGESCSEYSAGRVKIAPATTDAETPPIPVMMTFWSSGGSLETTRVRPIARIEIGIAASMTWPTLSPEYAEATVKRTQKKSPQNNETPVASGNLVPAGTIGL